MPVSLYVITPIAKQPDIPYTAHDCQLGAATMGIDEFFERHRAIVQGKAGSPLHRSSLEKTRQIPAELLELYNCIAAIQANENDVEAPETGTTTADLPNKDIV